MIISDATVSTRRLPYNFAQEDIRLFESYIKKNIKEAKLLTLDNFKIGYDGIIFKGISIFKESLCYDERLVRGLNNGSIRTLKFYLKFFLKNLLAEQISSQEDYIWITDQYSNNYFHWFCEAIPRLVNGMKVVENPNLLLPASYKGIDYVERSLKIFSPSTTTFIPNNTCYQVRKLFFPTYLAESGHYNDALMQQLRNRFREYFVGKQNVFLGERIYISRVRAGRRKILNEGNLIALLQKYSFTPVVFEDYSFEEQVSIVLNAKYLISNHGAGLTNMLFMDKGTAVFELRRQGDCANNCYFALASALDIRYYYQTCEPEFDGDKELTLSPDSNYNLKDHQYFLEFTHHGNLIVDLEKLESNLNLMLEEA